MTRDEWELKQNTPKVTSSTQITRDTPEAIVKQVNKLKAEQAAVISELGIPKRRKKLAEINAWRKEFGLDEQTGDYTKGQNSVWNAKYKYERNLYRANVANREAGWRTMGGSARVLARKQQTNRSNLAVNRKNAAGQTDGGNIATYRRRGKRSLIQRAVQTGLTSSGSGTQL